MSSQIPCQNELSSIGILIGNEYYNDIMSTERVKIHERLYIIKSKFGWMINRRTKIKEAKRKRDVNHDTLYEQYTS